MVGSDVEHHGDVGLEVVHVFELERAQLDDIDVVVLARNLQGEATAYVAGESDIYTGLTQYVVCQQCCSGLSVRACDTYHLGVGVASGELDFRYYRYPFFRDFYH